MFMCDETDKRLLTSCFSERQLAIRVNDCARIHKGTRSHRGDPLQIHYKPVIDLANANETAMLTGARSIEMGDVVDDAQHVFNKSRFYHTC